MVRLVSLTIMFLSLDIQANSHFTSLEQVEGVWWYDCDDPVGAFYIDGDTYGGDFLGTHKVELLNNVLTFTKGFPEGHDVNVRNTAMSFKILDVTKSKLVLASTPTEYSEGPWTLYKCD